MNREEIEQILNHCLNDVLCKRNTLKRSPSSNKIAEYVSDWLDANESTAQPKTTEEYIKRMSNASSKQMTDKYNI